MGHPLLPINYIEALESTPTTRMCVVCCFLLVGGGGKIIIKLTGIRSILQVQLFTISDPMNILLPLSNKLGLSSSTHYFINNKGMD